LLCKDTGKYKSMKRDWFAILIVVIEIAVVFGAGALFYVALRH